MSDKTEVLGIRLKGSEAAAMREAASSGGFPSVSAWAKKILLAVAKPLGSGVGHGTQGDPAIGVSVPQHETPSTAPKRSWADLPAQERMELGREWAKTVPLPPGFNDLPPVGKITWLNQNWPLG